MTPSVPRKEPWTVNATTTPAPTHPTADPRWASLAARDAAADGTFVYGVRTTGVYCRPSCGARRPWPENVSFHATPADAERAGFRACKRCRPGGPAPDEQRTERVAALCRLIERREAAPALAELAHHAGWSPFHTQRVFKAVTGVTPRAYAAARRAERVRGALRGSETVTAAFHRAGYGSSSRFYEASNARLGMTPRAFRDGGRDATIRFAIGECSLGSVLVAATPRGVCAILLGDDPEALAHDLERAFPKATLLGAGVDFERVVARVVALVERPTMDARLPLDIRGTAFQQRVWAALSAVPAGGSTTYAALAAAIGAPKSVRAVGRACAANRVAVAIPCHRVVRTDGGLSGYRWGVERKRELLAREARP